MKHLILYIILPVLLLTSCSGSVKKEDLTDKQPEIILQTAAAFKSAEHIYGDDWKLIFRKIDDCQYIIFHTDINTINSFRDKLILSDGNSAFTNHDFVNLRFNVNYTEETSPDPVTGENGIINVLSSIERCSSDRFAAAGFEDDTAVEDFILNLKKYVKTDSTLEISNMISYPLNITNRKSRIKINNPESFIKDYNIIFNKKVKNSIINQPLADVMASSKGLMIGAGEILINKVDSKIHITSINNY
ncbi:MAG: hypothetical protein CVV49_03790 [Spirochaetae bacterium HGW-Spirochaetae-5]|nr:MAG: hypothetical protein CVV49_03790 [Spirochaetae bacterium HGW-Spirochaetae-5]